MRAALDTVMNSKDSRFERLMYIHDTFSFLIQMKTLMVMNDTQDEGAWASDLQTKCINFAKVYSGDVGGNCLAREIQDCQVLIQKYASSVDLTLPGVLQFIVSYGGNDVFPNLRIGLQLLLTISTSVAGCERSFSKMKLILICLRSTMTEKRHTNLALLSIEFSETLQHVDFSNVIDAFASVKSRSFILDRDVTFGPFSVFLGPA
jgi:hypothetical protein